MLSKIHKWSADYAAFLLELSKSLECRAKAKIKEARKHSLKDLGRGVTVNFAMALSTLVTFTYFIWEFDHIHRLYDSVVMNLLVAWFPIAAFYEGIHQKDNDRRFSLQYAGIAALSVSILLLAFSNRHELHELGINVVLIMASFPWLFIFWKLVRRKRGIGNWHGAGGNHVDGLLGCARALGGIGVVLLFGPTACCLNPACRMDSPGMAAIQGC